MGDAPTLRVLVLGLGEAGSLLAADLVERGVATTGWDPDGTRRVLPGVTLAASPGEAAREADVVLSVNSGAAAPAAAASVGPSLGAHQLYADLNTASAALKRSLADTVAPSGAAFVDVALLG